MPESAQAWRVTDPAFGSRWLESFAFFNPEWSSSKTSQDSCVPFEVARGSLLSESYSLIWPNSGLMLDGVVYELPMWELHTFAPASSSSDGNELLPTPSANDRTGAEDLEARQERGAGGSSLRDLPRLLPTPAAEEARGTAEQHLARKNKDGAKRTAVTALGILVKTMPTPTAGDANASGSRNLEGSRAKPGMSLTDAVKSGDSKTPRLLPTPVANEENPGSGGELRAAVVHGVGRRNGSGTDTMGRPNKGRTPRLPTPQAADGERTSEVMMRGEGNPTLLGVARAAMLPTPTTQNAHNNAGPSQLERNSAALDVVVAHLPSPTARTANRGKGDAERFRGPKSQGGRRSNLEDALEAAKEGSPWIGESSSPPSSDGSGSSEIHPHQLTILGDSILDSPSGCSDTPATG